MDKCDTCGGEVTVRSDVPGVWVITCQSCASDHYRLTLTQRIEMCEIAIRLLDAKIQPVQQNPPRRPDGRRIPTISAW